MIDKAAIVKHFDKAASNRSRWFYRNYLYHDQILRCCTPFLNPDSHVLDLGCSTGDMLHALRPRFGVGVDISPQSIATARWRFPDLHWVCADAEDLPLAPPLDTPFDVILLADVVGYLADIQETLQQLHRLSHPRTRVIISMWNWMWEPVLRAGEALHLKSADLDVLHNWVSPAAISNLLELAGYTTLQVVPGVLLPYAIPGVTPLINTLSYAPLMRRLTLLSTVVARPAVQPAAIQHTSVTVVIPTRNEVSNIEAVVQRVPDMGTHTELLFIDGNSTDGTVEKIYEQIDRHPERDIKFMPQSAPQESSLEASTPPNLMLKLGKGHAVRKAFAAASGDILMILDSDLTVLPEELPKFYAALVTGRARFINGTRFTYPHEDNSMPVLNRWGNVFFSVVFSWLLDQPITDTLCGTKVLYRADYQGIAANRAYFGDFDPFGDFDLLFGAARLGYRIIDLPVHYKARTSGESKVRLGIHGPLLLRMSIIAFWQLKLRPLLTNRKTVRRSTTGTQQAILRAEKQRSRQSTLISVGVILVLLLALIRFSSRSAQRR